jgi:hypothetical protein
VNGYYAGKIKVVCEDRRCFPVDPKTMEALSTGCYDAYAFTDPDPEPVETISFTTWIRRKNALSRRGNDGA